MGVSPNDLMKKFTTTEFLNPNPKKATKLPGFSAAELATGSKPLTGQPYTVVKTHIDFVNNIYTGQLVLGL